MIGLVNVINTTASDDVEEIEELLNEYNSKTSITLEDIGDFHFRFERIHPFGDEAESLSKPAIYRKNYCNYKISEMLGNLFLIV